MLTCAHRQVLPAGLARPSSKSRTTAMQLWPAWAAKSMGLLAGMHQSKATACSLQPFFAFIHTVTDAPLQPGGACLQAHSNMHLSSSPASEILLVLCQHQMLAHHAVVLPERLCHIGPARLSRSRRRHESATLRHALHDRLTAAALTPCACRAAA